VEEEMLVVSYDDTAIQWTSSSQTLLMAIQTCTLPFLIQLLCHGQCQLSTAITVRLVSHFCASQDNNGSEADFVPLKANKRSQMQWLMSRICASQDNNGS
jgi:hypothetical protein